MFIPSLKLCAKRSCLSLCRSRPLIVQRWTASDARRRSSSLGNASGTYTGSRGDEKRVYPRLLLISLASGIAGYTTAQATGSHAHLPMANVATSDAQSLQYGTSKDVQNAVKELQLTFSSTDVVSTDVDDLCTHGGSVWDHRTSAYDRPSPWRFIIRCFTSR
jgi:D-lactate dehydrogenase (cytochrome)